MRIVANTYPTNFGDLAEPQATASISRSAPVVPAFTRKEANACPGSSCRRAHGRRRMVARPAWPGARNKAGARTIRVFVVMRIVVLALLAIALGAASPPAEVDGDPVALLTAIYKTYTDIGPGEDGVPGLPGICSKRLQALIDKDEKETPEGDVGLFMGLVRRRPGLAAKRAQDRAGFARNRPGRGAGDLQKFRRTARHSLHARAGRLPKPRWTMSKILLDAPDAFPDAEFDEK